MIDVPVYNMNGEQTGTMQIDEAILGTVVRTKLLKQAVVTWRTRQRQGSARTKNRAQVQGSTRKLYRQKGTGNARVGPVRSPIRRGGGVADASRERNYRPDMPRRMKQIARQTALLSRLKDKAVAVIDPLAMDQPKTKSFFTMLKALGADRGCVVALDGPNEVLYKAGRNIPRTQVLPVYDLNAYELLRRRKVLFTRKAFEAVQADPLTFKVASEL